jgi:hypothetical protein
VPTDLTEVKLPCANQFTAACGSQNLAVSDPSLKDDKPEVNAKRTDANPTS